MDIQDIVSPDYESLDADERVASLAGIFDDPSEDGVVVLREGEVAGVVTRRQLAASRLSPEQKLESLIWSVPRVPPDADVREVAQLMIDSDSRILPVFEGERMIGVVRQDDLLEAVQPFLEVATVEDVATDDLVVVTPETTFGEALNAFREHRITHLPVVDEGSAVGILSLYDVTGLTVRATTRSQGGEGGGTDAFGGSVSGGAGRSHGGFGAREGDLARILDVPVRDLMVSPVRTIESSATLDDAVAAMFEVGGSALVVADGQGGAVGIVTKTDVLDVLTWEAEGNRAVQVYGADLMDDLTYDAVVSAVEKFDGMDRGAALLDAKVHFHEHDETLRGTSLLLARIRVYTDQGMFLATGEGYGARHAFNEARDVLERRIRDAKTHGQSKKHPDEAYWERRFGWLLES